MSLLDNIKKSSVDVRDASGCDVERFYIRPNGYYLDDFIQEYSDYQIYLSAVCGFLFDDGIFREMYEQMLSELYDEVREFPGVVDCSPIGIVTMKESVNVRVQRGYELIFGINGDVRSVYGALRLVYGLCSLLWLKNIHHRVPIAVVYSHNLELQRTYVREDFFKDFYDFKHHEHKLGMYGAWKVFAWKLLNREEWMTENEKDRTIDKCSEWYIRSVKNTKDGFIIDSESISASMSITSKGSDFERYCGHFLKD